MKKQSEKLKRVTALVTLSAVLCTQVPVLGASKKDSSKLTVTQAVNMAVSNSNEIQTLYESSYINSLNRDDLIDAMEKARGSDKYVDAAVALFKSDIQSASNSNSVAVQKKSLELSITQFFSAIQIAEKELVLFEKELEVAQKELNVAKTKRQLGLLSDMDYQNQKTAYDKSVASKSTKEQAIDNAYKSLNQVLGRSLDTKYDIELSLSYSPMRNVNLTAYIANAVDTNMNVINSRRSIELSEYEYTNTDYDSDSLKESKEISIQQEKRSLQELKDSIEEKITSYYDEIQTCEQNYSEAVTDLKTLKNELEVKQLQYELGKVTELEIQNLELQIAKQEHNIFNLANSHALAVMKFNYTDILR